MRTKSMYTKASKVTVTKADGTVEVLPAYKTVKEIKAAVYNKQSQQK